MRSARVSRASRSPTAQSAASGGRLADRQLAEQWREYHQEHAVLALLSSQENLRRPRR
ncbi:hypothetical protein [Streptomyces phaeochromogenes]|uniref:hypothetical protein n=1 Tax=Streptomyces phaeochromogenes TaxID=1923 RepID=UPI0036C3F4CE